MSKSELSHREVPNEISFRGTPPNCNSKHVHIPTAECKQAGKAYLARSYRSSRPCRANIRDLSARFASGSQRLANGRLYPTDRGRRAGDTLGLWKEHGEGAARNGHEIRAEEPTITERVLCAYKRTCNDGTRVHTRRLL